MTRTRCQSRGDVRPDEPFLDFDAFSRAIISPTVPPASSWRPRIVRITPRDATRFEVFCRARRLTVIDTIDQQLMDLATLRDPSTEADADRSVLVRDTLAAHAGGAAYGNWVFLPWEAKIVHLLDRDAYFEVVTNRNQDKITRAEQKELRGKRIGVVGLSVGGEAAVTVAQEHLCGHIVLADFDRLDLSNLNRVNAGFDEIGLNKARLAARRIAKINPYLEVTLFEDGVTAENIRDFVDGLDLIIDECDDVQVKHRLRVLAKSRRINVVFAADERGFLSVEPYALWPDLPSFHGRIQRAQPAREAFATPLEFMKEFTEWMGGWRNISERSRRSLERVGKTLAGYPQLASEARYAAGQLGYVARRLLLGERLSPFIGNLDLMELLSEPCSPQ